MKKIILFLVATFIALSFSAYGNTYVAQGSDELQRNSWPFSEKACMYVYPADYAEIRTTLEDGAMFSGDNITVSKDEVLWVHINNFERDVTMAQIIFTSKDGNMLFEKTDSKTDLVPYGQSMSTRASLTGNFLQLPTNRLYGECTAKLTVERNNKPSEHYTFYISVRDGLVPIDYTKYELSSTNPDLLIRIECENLTQTAYEENYSNVSILSKNGVECFDFNVNKIWMKEATRTSDETIHRDAPAKPLKAESLNIPFTRSGTETDYRLTIPQGTFLLDNGWNEEFILNFETETVFAEEWEYILNVSPEISFSGVIIEEGQELIPFSIEIDKKCIIVKDMKIMLNNEPIEYLFSEGSDCFKITFEIPTNKNYYNIIFEDGKITLPNGRKNYKLSYTFQTHLTSSFDLEKGIFIDVPSDNWAYEYITSLTQKGIVSGYEDGTFRPAHPVTRAELAKLLCTAFEITVNTENIFSDTKDHWAKSYITALSNKIPLRGNGDSLFLPNEPATREEVAASIIWLLRDTNAIKNNKTITFSDVEEFTPELLSDVEIAASSGIVSGYPDGTFRPSENITRAEMATIIHKVIR